jgi:hypothetical protein
LVPLAAALGRQCPGLRASRVRTGTFTPHGPERPQICHHPFYGKSQGGRAAGWIFLWWFSFFYTAEKPEKSRIWSKIDQILRAGHFGE